MVPNMCKSPIQPWFLEGVWYLRDGPWSYFECDHLVAVVYKWYGMQLCRIALHHWWLVTFSSLRVSHQRVYTIHGLDSNRHPQINWLSNCCFLGEPYPVLQTPSITRIRYSHQIPVRFPFLVGFAPPFSDAPISFSWLTSLNIPYASNII